MFKLQQRLQTPTTTHRGPAFKSGILMEKAGPMIDMLET